MSDGFQIKIFLKTLVLVNCITPMRIWGVMCFIGMKIKSQCQKKKKLFRPDIAYGYVGYLCKIMIYFHSFDVGVKYDLQKYDYSQTYTFTTYTHI